MNNIIHLLAHLINKIIQSLIIYFLIIIYFLFLKVIKHLINLISLSINFSIIINFTLINILFVQKIVWYV